MQQFLFVLEKFDADFNAATIAFLFTVNIPKDFLTTSAADKVTTVYNVLKGYKFK